MYHHNELEHLQLGFLGYEKYLLTVLHVLPLFSYPTVKGTYKIKYGPELSLDKSEEKDQIILDWTQKMEQYIESIIQKNPTPWMCGHRRWKTRPKGEEKIY